MLSRCFAVVLGATAILTLNGCKTIPNVEPSTGASSAALNAVVDHTNDNIANIKRDAAEIKTDAKGYCYTLRSLGGKVITVHEIGISKRKVNESDIMGE